MKNNEKAATLTANAHGFLTQEQVMRANEKDRKNMQFVIDPERSYPVYTHDFEIACMSYKFFRDKGEMVMMYREKPCYPFSDYYTDYDEETEEQMVFDDEFTDEQKEIWNKIVK